MTEQATTPAASDSHGHDEKGYVKIWGVLLVLLAASVLGPLANVPWLTLITAFGIAFVKAYLVAKNFMHLHIERRYVTYCLVTCVALSLVFFAGTAPDVMRHSGQRWENLAAKAEVERVMKPRIPATIHDTAPRTPEQAFASVCAGCHGSEGDGAGPAAVALNPKPANFQSAEFWRSRDRAHIAKVIQQGGASVGKSALMPGFGSQFDEAAALAIADFLSARFAPEKATP